MADDLRSRIQKAILTGDNRLKQGAGTEKARASYEQALELAERHLLVNYRDEYGGGKWKHPLIGAEDATPVNQLDALGKDRFIIGDPDRCIQIIRRFVEALGVTHLVFRLFFPGTPHAHILRSLELLGKHVIPAFR